MEGNETLTEGATMEATIQILPQRDGNYLLAIGGEPQMRDESLEYIQDMVLAIARLQVRERYDFNDTL